MTYANNLPAPTQVEREARAFRWMAENAAFVRVFPSFRLRYPTKCCGVYSDNATLEELGEGNSPLAAVEEAIKASGDRDAI